MLKHYVVTSWLLGSAALSAHAQKLISTTDVKLNDFTIPPYAIDVVRVELNPSGFQYQTAMPIAGRMAATTDAAKMRGAQTTPSGVYVYSAQTDAAGQFTTGQGTVFSPANPRVKLEANTPVDWAVWGTNATDGPLRIAYGGDYNQFSTLASNMGSKSTTLVSLVSSGPGQDYDNYSAFPLYYTTVRTLDPVSGRLTSRVEKMNLPQSENQAKLTRYMAVAGDSPEQAGRVIALSTDRFEAIATHFVKADKNASARQVSLLTFDGMGNLVKDQPVQFAYNRALTIRIPVADETGKLVGTLSVFGSGPGKKDAQDPQENRFSVVVTDEQGGIWSQFEWVANGSSNRAAMPTYALRQGDQLLVYSTNQQKLLKPVEEGWRFDRSGKAVQTGTLAYGDIGSRSKEVGTASPENRQAWFNYTTGYYMDSFTDANGEIWVLFQRHANLPITSTQEAPPSPATPVVGSRLMNFANKLNQMTGQSAPTPVSSPASTASALSRANDVFVLHLDKDLVLKQQTVVALQGGNLRFKRIVSPTGMLYLLNDKANTLLSIKGGTLAVERLTPSDATVATSSEVDNFVLDSANQKLYTLYKMTKKPAQGKLLIYDLK